MKQVAELLSIMIRALTIKRLKQYLFIVLSLFLFLFYQESIHDFIQYNLLVGARFLNAYVITGLFLTVILLSYFAVRIVFINKYVPSYSEIFIGSAILFVVVYYKLNSTWGYQSMNFLPFEVPYIFILLLPVAVFLGCHCVNIIRPKIFVKILQPNTNEFIDDSPIIKIDDDRHDTERVAKNLLRILKNEKHTNSFTVGLVGPWGNGKSSIMNLVKDGFNDKTDKDTIVIHFLPYLNHSENDIINEFFILLSNELGKYSGKVSNQLMTYSKKLTALYKDKNIFDFLDNQITKIESTSANELYNDINERLVEIDKKIIVLVDDLDRLNEKEILQVLKLIRNTANFNNTFFAVAMDKEYVLSRLKANNDILNTNFIDKFFQLEIYLPELDNSVLRNYFFECLMKSPLAKSDDDFENQLINAMSAGDNLFDDYVKNFRDVKRVVNQIIYDYPLFKKEIDLKDFLNFTYFKLKFPKYMKVLSDRKASFVYIDTAKGTYNLKKAESSQDFSEALRKRPLYSFDNFEKYEIYKSKHIEVCKENDLSINCEDQMLLVKTLAYLFGEENTVPDVSSIKHENNFRNVMQQRIPSNYFSQSEFVQLYNNAELDEMLLVLFNAQEKLPQLLNRLKFYNSQDEASVKRTLEILVELYDKRETFKLYDQEILLLLETFVQRQFEAEKSKPKTTFPDWLTRNIFEKEAFSMETRLLLLGFVATQRSENENWGIPKDYTDRKVTELFLKYLTSFSGNLGQVYEYPIYRVYHSIKVIKGLRSRVNEIFIAFWEKHLEFFCAQTTDLDAFSNNRFHITDTVVELFGSKQKFVSFVKANEEKNKSKGLDEFLRFFKLLEVVNFEGGLLFEFEESALMKDKVAYVLTTPGRSTYNEDEKNCEVFFETNHEELMVNTVRNAVFQKDYKVRNFTHEGRHYLFIRVNKKEAKVTIANFLNEALIGYGTDSLPTVKPSDIKPGYAVQFMDIYIRIYSIEPKIKNR